MRSPRCAAAKQAACCSGWTDVSDDREGHYRVHFELSPARLGARANARWDADPRGLGIVLSRYKFVGKMLAGKSRVLEVGCGDAWASRVVQQEIRPGVLFGT